MHCEYDSKKRAAVFSVLEASSLVYIIIYLHTYFNLTSSQCGKKNRYYYPYFKYEAIRAH